MDRRNGRSNGRRAAVESNGRRAAAESNGRRSSVSPRRMPPPPLSEPAVPPPPSPPAETPPPDAAELAARSAAYFDDLFGPSSRGMVRSYASSAAANGHRPAYGTPAAGNGAESSSNGDYPPYIMARSPWQYGNSIFYGGQEDIYIPPTRPSRRPQDDINDESQCNIGDWWRGSYHY